MYEEFDERSLLSSSIPQPTYTFDSSLARIRKRQVRRFQCCVCVIFLSIIVISMVISVAFNINNYPKGGNNTINDTFIVFVNKIPLDSWNATKSRKIIPQNTYNDAVNAGKEALRKREILEEDTPELDKDSPSYKHQKIVFTSCKARELGKIGYAEENAAKHLKKILKGHNAEFCYNNTIMQSDVFNYCNKTIPVCKTIFRSFDGSCNNLKHPEFGIGYRPFRRILKPTYSDGISAPRKSVSGKALPSARQVSLTVHRPIYKDDPEFTIMLAVFGQFLDHDITATALSQGENGKSIACCSVNKDQLHPECFPVILDPNDPNTLKYNVTCMEFVRSLPAPTCCFGMREQLNQATSFIDASVIYGDLELSQSLRTLTDGKLKMMKTPDGRDLLPASEDLNDGCNREEEASKGRYCFATGDGRANENLHLTSMHLLWARQHNTIAGKLLQLNKHWNDERVFQETRKIISGMLQHIAYNEFLKILLEDKVMEHFDLKPVKEYYKGYDENIDATVANSFAASAFRFAHTLIPSLIKMIGNNGSNEVIELRKLLLDPFQLYDNGTMDRTLNGASDTHIEANDPYFSIELKQHMFERPMNIVATPKICGLDLVSLNIQRGRDHGLPGYTNWREHCGLRRPRSFQQLVGDIDDESLDHMAKVYEYVDDIDLYTGAISEKPLQDGFLGPTLTCLILDQFVRLKRGDRFWYENPGQFTRKQLKEIRKITLARIICDNSDGVKEIQKEVMRRTMTGNEKVKCDKIPEMNFEYWQEFKRIPMANDNINIHVIT